MPDTEFRGFLEACPIAALVLDSNDRIQFANPAASSLFCRSELIGSAIRDHLPAWPVASGDDVILIETDGGECLSCRVQLMVWPEQNGTVTAILIGAQPAMATARPQREAELRLRCMIEMLPEAMCVFDANDRFILWNKKYADLYADIAEQLRPGMSFEEILRLSIASDQMQEATDDRESWLQARLEKFRQPVSREEQQLRDGRWLRYEDRRTPDGGAIGMRIDITELKQREEWLHQLFIANPMPMLLCDANSLEIIEANRASGCFYGVEPDALLSKKVSDFQVDEDAKEFERKLRELEGDCEPQTVWRQRTATGMQRHVLIYVRYLREGLHRRLLLTIADVSERVLAEAEANRLALHDALTGLPNRTHFYKALDEALRLSHAGGIAVHCLDLDGFKPINDTFGHAMGDDVLKMVGARLQAAAHGHLVARLGGDEFAVLQVAGSAGDPELAERCIAALQVPFLIRGLPISLGASIGIARATTGATDGESIVQAADRALYRAKAEGRNTWRKSGEEHFAPRQAGAR
jgi:diguanylate cyclase (GGDEF)-like protein/PAS domain S-box-containing protein